MAKRVKRGIREIEQALESGEWLKIGDLMTLFDASRSAVDRWLTEGVRVAGPDRLIIRYRHLAGGDRVAHPGDVLVVLRETRRIRSADDPEGRSGLTTD